MDTTFKLGKTPARKDSIALQFGNYVTKKLPAPPVSAGHKDLMGTDNWGMLANDKYGDCVWAGAGHETLLWNREAGISLTIEDKDALDAYAAVTGFKPNDPSTDNGTDMQAAAKYRQDIGLTDLAGNVHKVAAYLALQSDTDIKRAIYYFGAVGIGIKFPDYAMEQFKAGKDWEVKSHGKIEGGHYIPAISYDKNWVYIVTWGKVVRASWGFIKKYMDEGVVYLSKEMLVGGKSPEGFDITTLQADLLAIRS